MLAAIEIYNKPAIEYREESFIILLLNAWELVFKALLSKNRKSTFYPKRRKEAYRTLSWQDALTPAERFFPASVSPFPVRKNLDLLSTYRDNAVHFYNAKGFGCVIYALAQTSIVNFNDLLKDSFHLDLGEELTWHLMPIGLQPPIDPVEYISKGHREEKQGMFAIRQFIAELVAAFKEVQAAGAETSRLMTVFTLKLESTKKTQLADAIVGVATSDTTLGPLAIFKTQDPNITHPLRQKEVVAEIERLHEMSFTPYTFQAIVWRHQIKENPKFCWRATEGVLTRYSRDIVPWIRGLAAADVQAAINQYRQFQRDRSRKSRMSK